MRAAAQAKAAAAPATDPVPAAGAAVPDPAAPAGGAPGAAPSPAAAPAPAAPEPTLLDIVFQRTGKDFRGKFQNEVEFLDRAANAMAAIGQRDLDAEYGRQVRAHEREFLDFMHWRETGQMPASLQQQAPVTQNGQPQPQARSTWDIPTFNPQWQQFLTQVTDPNTGDVRTEIAPHTPAPIRQQIEAYKTARYEFAQRWETDPRAMVQELVRPMAEEMFQGMMQQTLQQRDAHQVAQQITQQNQAWMFERDQATGQFRFDPYTNQPVLTQRGQLYVDFTRNFGHLTNDPQVLHQLALNHANGQLAMQALQVIGPALTANQQVQPTAPGQPPHNGQPAPQAPAPAAPARAPIPPGAGFRPNSTGGSAPGNPAPTYFPEGTSLKNAIRHVGRRAAGIGA